MEGDHNAVIDPEKIVDLGNLPSLSNAIIQAMKKSCIDNHRIYRKEDDANVAEGTFFKGEFFYPPNV